MTHGPNVVFQTENCKDFVSLLNAPMSAFDRANSGNLRAMKLNVKRMITAFEEMKKVCDDMLAQIRERMKKGPESYQTKK